MRDYLFQIADILFVEREQIKQQLIINQQIAEQLETHIRAEVYQQHHCYVIHALDVLDVRSVVVEHLQQQLCLFYYILIRTYFAEIVESPY